LECCDVLVYKHQLPYLDIRLWTGPFSALLERVFFWHRKGAGETAFPSSRSADSRVIGRELIMASISVRIASSSSNDKFASAKLFTSATTDPQK